MRVYHRITKKLLIQSDKKKQKKRRGRRFCIDFIKARFHLRSFHFASIHICRFYFREHINAQLSRRSVTFRKFAMREPWRTIEPVISVRHARVTKALKLNSSFNAKLRKDENSSGGLSILYCRGILRNTFARWECITFASWIYLRASILITYVYSEEMSHARWLVEHVTISWSVNIGIFSQLAIVP